MSSDWYQEHNISFVDVVITFLSIYVIVALSVDLLFDLWAEISKILYVVDNFICIFFLWDFIVRYRKANSKMQFLKRGRVDLLSSIPTISFLRYGRVFRLVRIFRLLKAFKSIKHFMEHIFKYKNENIVFSTWIIVIFMIVFSSISILIFEWKYPESNIHTAEDAIWWVFTTLSTVWYWDKYPITAEGRFIAVLLMIVGISTFSIFSAYMHSYFLWSKEIKDE